MTLQYLLKKAGVALLMIALPAFFSANGFAQIKVFERTQETDISKIGLYRDSESRLKISLNGEWEVSFNLGKSFQKVSVPLSYSFDEKAIFRRKFSIPAEYVEKYSFIFVAEGIDYESDIKINGNFVSTHIGGSAPIVTSVNDGIVSANNDILVSINSELNHSNTLPLSNQINYAAVNGGINKDIYLLAVPKLHVIKSIVKYSVDNVLSVRMMNVISIKSSNLSRFIGEGNDSAFSVKTVVLRKSTGEEAASSNAQEFDIGENNSIRLENQLSIPNAILWTPEKPELYMLKTIIYSGKSVVDEFIQETGFTNFSLKGGEIFINGRQTRLKGINYFEDQPKGSTALSYELVEKDLSQIKNLGFNAIRVPGRSAHPYVVELSNKLGLLLMQEIPMNESADEYLEEEKYVRLMLNTLSDIVERDMNAPCVLAWGIGNDFDVSEKASVEYVRSAVSSIDSLNDRLTYYTSRTWNDDICSELVDFVGINFYGKKYDEIKTSVTELTNRQKPPSNRKNPNIFAARFGIRIDNSNSNGFSDSYSQEAQMKFMNECYPKIMQSTMGGFLSSFADWHSSNPLNFRLSEDQYLVTDGIHTYLREEKRSAGFVKRILLNEDLPRIQEGNFIPDFPYVFIIIGIAVMILLLYFLNRDKKLRSSMLRCLYKPTYFYSLVKDQMIISTGYNLLLALSISIGLSLYFSSILYFLKASNSLDMLLAKVFSNDSTKLLFSEIVNNKFYLISTVAIIQFLLITLTSFFLYFVSFYTRGKSFFKNIFTISVWSTLPMLIFLPIGTVIYKLSEGNSSYISITLWLFFMLYVLYLNRILLGARSLFDIKTGKVYIYGLAIILIFYAGLYFYMWYFTGATETFDLIRNLTAR